MAVDNGSILIPDPSSNLLPPFPNCTWSDCVTLDVRFIANNPAAVVDTYPWITSVVDVFKKNGYKMSMSEVPITSFADLKKYYAQVA